MNKATLITLAGIIVLLVAGFSIVSKGAATTGSITTGSSVDKGKETVQAAPSEDVQRITLGAKNFNYNPNTIRVKAGIPVELTIDKTVGGCLRAFAVRDLGVSQYAATPADKIRFTPKKAGTFTFSCSMGMGFGKLVVE